MPDTLATAAERPVDLLRKKGSRSSRCWSHSSFLLLTSASWVGKESPSTSRTNAAFGMRLLSPTARRNAASIRFSSSWRTARRNRMSMRGPPERETMLDVAYVVQLRLRTTRDIFSSRLAPFLGLYFARAEITRCDRIRVR